MKKKTHPVIFLSFIILNLMNPINISAQKQHQESGIFENNSDIGKVTLPGNATYDSEKQTYTMEGSGTNIWFGNDEFHYLWKKIKGDFILTAQVEFIGKGVESHRKIGWMVRQSMEPDSPQVSAMIHGDGLTSLQYRLKKGADMEEKRITIVSPDIVQLVRKGNTYKMSVAHWGETFVSEELTDSTIQHEAYVGLFICSHNPNVSEKAIFRNVRIEIPASANLIPYKDYLGSSLETMEVETGARKILFQVPYSIQAPNWTPDGKTLIFNSKGLLYNFDIATGKFEILNTGIARNNNNDHVLSFDGKIIGISHHSVVDKNQSVIFYLPVTGGQPTRVTSGSPSYLHGWSPDKKFLIYTGARNGKFNIYKIPVEGGQEIQLTHGDALDDGSEYTPDGNTIYFNSTRTGTMQIWRMKPDGSNQEQITSDTLNNWFPHISPDGKSIVFITFLNDVKPTEHPFYKQVYLRMIPINGGHPKVIAYLYGGQGTINVPSWSPDSKRIAFVSNSDNILK